MDALQITALATGVVSYLTLRFGWPLFGYAKAAVSRARAGLSPKDGNKAQPLPLDPAVCASCLATHFAHLREHFRETGQDDRVAVMDDRLAAGLFVVKGQSVPGELLHLRIAEVPDGEA